MRIVAIFFVCILSLFWQKSFGQNLALHCPYTLSEKPNYPHTAPLEDKTSLTDGQYATPYDQGKKRYWTQKTFLGWNYKDKVRVTIDLKKTENIGSVVFSTAANGNVQYFPKNVYVFVSKDNRSYTYIGDAANVNYPPHDRPRRLKLVLNNIDKEARYVSIVAVAHKNKLFCDEIEVRAKNYTPKKEEKVLVAKAGKSNYSKAYGQLAKHPSKKDQEVEKLQQAIQKNFLLNLSEKYQTPFLVSKVSPWLDLRQLHQPSQVQSAINYEFLVPVDGVQYGAFTVTNSSQSAKQISFKIKKRNTNLYNLRLYKVPFVPTGYGDAVADPLLPLSNTMNLNPGETKLIFISVEGTNVGEENNTIIVYNSKKQVSINIATNVYDLFKENDKFQLNANVWAYLNVPTLRNIKQQAVKDLKAHHVNTAMIEPWFLPKVHSSDFSELLNYLHNYEEIENIFLRIRYEQRLPANFLSAEWKENFKNWYANLLKAVHQNGFPKAKVYFYPYDEVSKPLDIANYKKLIKWTRNAVPNIKFVATFNKKRAIEELLPLVDVGIISGGHGLFENLPDTKAEIWTYRINGNARMKSPYKRYRLMGWKAFYKGRTGVGFWNYSISNGGKLNKLDNALNDPRKNYAAIYNGADKTLISSRRWEAFRLGIEDYQIIYQYAQMFGRKKALKMVKAVLENPDDYSKADEVRDNMINELIFE